MIVSAHLEGGQSRLTSISSSDDLLSCRIIRIKWICPEFNSDFSMVEASSEMTAWYNHGRSQKYITRARVEKRDSQKTLVLFYWIARLYISEETVIFIHTTVRTLNLVITVMFPVTWSCEFRLFIFHSVNTIIAKVPLAILLIFITLSVAWLMMLSVLYTHVSQRVIRVPLVSLDSRLGGTWGLVIIH